MEAQDPKFEDLESLSVRNADSIVLFPYELVEPKNWPTYVNDEGARVPVPEGWRYLGYRYPYPTPKRVGEVRELSSGLSMKEAGEEVNIKTGDPDRLASHLAYTLIGSIVQKDPGTRQTKETTLDNKLRNWLCGEFRKSGFLLGGAYADYLAEGRKTVESESAEQQDFT